MCLIMCSRSPHLTVLGYTGTRVVRPNLAVSHLLMDIFPESLLSLGYLI